MRDMGFIGLAGGADRFRDVRCVGAERDSGSAAGRLCSVSALSMVRTAEEFATATPAASHSVRSWVHPSWVMPFVASSTTTTRKPARGTRGQQCRSPTTLARMEHIHIPRRAASLAVKDTHASVARPVTNTLETLAFRSIASSPVFSWEPYSQSPKAEYDSTDAWVPLRMMRSDLSLQQHHHQRSLHAPARRYVTRTLTGRALGEALRLPCPARNVVA